MSEHSDHSTDPWAVEPSRPRAVVARQLRKSFGGVHALDRLDIDVAPHSIHAIVGENGAGKSTFMNILSGSLKADSGELEVFGQSMLLGDLKASRDLGIGIMHQELRLFSTRSVLANLFAGHELRKGPLVDRRKMAQIAEPVLERIGLSCSLDALVSSLSLSERQLVELARVLVEEPRLIILDEPTSALNGRESDRLLMILRELAQQGTTILYVSHRLSEVFAVSDEISVMRDGKKVLTKISSNLEMSEVVRAMVGDVMAEQSPRNRTQSVAATTVDLSVKNLTTGRQVSDVSITLGRGEIIGVAGLVGSGAEEILLGLFGAVPAKSTEAKYFDGGGLPRSPHEAAKRGVAYVPADRKGVGVMLKKSISHNVAQVSVGAIGAGPAILSKTLLNGMARSAIQELGIKAPDGDTKLSELSGGNQQKVVLAKWLEVKPQILLLDDPTRGVDVGAKGEIFRIMRDLAEQGKSVVFRSTELAELVNVCDRIYVIRDGKSVGEVTGVGEEELLSIINGG